MRPLEELFADVALRAKIRRKLPLLFAMAEGQASRAGRVGMEVGTLREQILIALLIYKFGEDKINLDIPIAEHEVDVRILGYPLSIKTVTASSGRIPPVKIVWTVDWERVERFVETYEPQSDLLLVVVRWGGTGGFYGIPLEVQRDVLQNLGKKHYLRLPKRGTNPRGVEISSADVRALLNHPHTKALPIDWQRPNTSMGKEMKLAPYTQWLRHWQLEE